jgi:hypothetical protein
MHTIATGTTLGYPMASTSSLPAGEYYAQAQLIKYDTYNRKDENIVLHGARI